MIALSRIKALKFRLDYASPKNFTGRRQYPKAFKARLHPLAFAKLEKAAALLQSKAPRLRLLIFDAMRPRSVQKRLFAFVKGTKQEPYVAKPYPGSMHNYGLALDLSLCDARGRELDMGTPFDSFHPLAQPRYEWRYRQKGRLSQKQLKNRRLLRFVMGKAGWRQHPLEWWHYDALRVEAARRGYSIVE